MNLKDVTDNNLFWETVNSLFRNKGGCRENIVLVIGDKIILDGAELAQTSNDFFKSCVNSLNISENRLLIIDTSFTSDRVEESIKRFEIHLSIRGINENVKIDQSFLFSEVNAANIRRELKKLDSKKAGTFMNIPTKHLKHTIDIICEPVMIIWNEEIVQNNKFPTKLKLADIRTIFKHFENILVKNYRPVSILPVVSKMFERMMQNQVNGFVERHHLIFVDIERDIAVNMPFWL